MPKSEEVPLYRHGLLAWDAKEQSSDPVTLACQISTIATVSPVSCFSIPSPDNRRIKLPRELLVRGGVMGDDTSHRRFARKITPHQNEGGSSGGTFSNHPPLAHHREVESCTLSVADRVDPIGPYQFTSRVEYITSRTEAGRRVGGRRGRSFGRIGYPSLANLSRIRSYTEGGGRCHRIRDLCVL